MFTRLLQQPVLRVWSGGMHLFGDWTKMTENSALFFFMSHCGSVHFQFDLESIWYKPPRLLNMQITFSRLTTGALTCQQADVSSADNSYFCRVFAQLYIFCVQESQRAIYFLPLLRARIYVQWLTTCLKQCQPAIMHNKGIVRFCLQIFWKAGSPFKAIRG